MSTTVQRLEKAGLISPPNFLSLNTHYETMMGSVAYGVSSDTSDKDIYGFCIPPKEIVFPHLSGEILGFGKQIKRFEQYQEHHIESKEDKTIYDLTIYNIVKYFQLCMENNPNMIDSLFTPTFATLHITKIGQMVKDNRKIFLHKGCWHKFKGYAYSQIHKMSNKSPDGKRKQLVEKFGYDVKFAYHVVRLMDEVEQILSEGDIDLLRNREQLKSIRRGEWSEQEIKEYFSYKERQLEKLYQDSKLPYSANEDTIKELLLNCLEQHYGNLDKIIVMPDKATQTLKQINDILQKHYLTYT